MKHFYLFLLLCTGLIISCNDNSEEDVILPSNLSVQIEKSIDTKGFVTVTISADNASRYKIEFQDGEDSETFIQTSNSASHQYSHSGTFNIITRAYSPANKFIEQTDTVMFEFETLDREIPTSGYSTPLTYDGFKLVWHDEFDGRSLNTFDWNYEIGNGAHGWGNYEEQYYRKENTVVGDGYLSIIAKKEDFDGYKYTSSRLTTQGKRYFRYGRVDIRAALPKGKGLWPAIWMLGEDISTVGWPRCGEIDIMEMVGGTDGIYSNSIIYGTVHWFAHLKADHGGTSVLSSGEYADEFHVFSIIWDNKEIRWLRDDKEYFSIAITESHMSEFHELFFFILNIAVGGEWPGSPDGSTVFPQSMHVDYIRYFEKL